MEKTDAHERERERKRDMVQGGRPEREGDLAHFSCIVIIFNSLIQLKQTMFEKNHILNCILFHTQSKTQLFGILAENASQNKQGKRTIKPMHKFFLFWNHSEKKNSTIHSSFTPFKGCKSRIPDVVLAKRSSEYLYCSNALRNYGIILLS